MATIRKRGDLQWEVQVRRKGFPPQFRTFSVIAEADAWAEVIESEMARGVFVSRTEAENTTLSEAMDRYSHEVSAVKKGAADEAVRIRYRKNHPLATRPLAGIRTRVIVDSCRNIDHPDNGCYPFEQGRGEK